MTIHNVNAICAIGSAWWRRHMETFSALLALCVRNSSVTGEFPSQRPVTHLNKRLSKQSWGWWSETPLHSLWRHCNGTKQCFTNILCTRILGRNVCFIRKNLFNHESACFTLQMQTVVSNSVQNQKGTFVSMYITVCILIVFGLTLREWHPYINDETTRNT